MENYYSYKIDRDLLWRVMLFIMVSFLILTFSELAFAGTEGGSDAADSNKIFERQLCRLVDIMKGTFAKVIATIAIFAAGAGFLLGKFNWVQSLTVAIGVIVIFYSPDLVNYISGGSNADCPTN